MGQRRASEAWEGATLGVGTDKALEAGKVLGGDEAGELQSCGRNAKRRDGADLISKTARQCQSQGSGRWAPSAAR